MLGLSIGDAIGERSAYNFYEVRDNTDFSFLPDGALRFTDDTEMAISIVESLQLEWAISEASLAWRFSQRFQADPDRGYGRMARRILQEISNGRDWMEVSSTAFGSGSFGNGAAMRVAPLGAYFADDLDTAVSMAEASARVTHFHPEGIAGAVAVAIASGTAFQNRNESVEIAGSRIRDAVLELVSSDLTLGRRLKKALCDLENSSATDVAREVGNGAEISAQDTVPFCIWNAVRCLGSFEEAVLSTIEVGGDCDTNAAIVAGIVTSYLGVDAIPGDWLRVCEKPNV